MRRILVIKKIVEVLAEGNTKPAEFQEMNSFNNKIKIKPIKIMVKKKSKLKSFLGKLFDDEHYIFF